MSEIRCNDNKIDHRSFVFGVYGFPKQQLKLTTTIVSNSTSETVCFHWQYKFTLNQVNGTGLNRIATAVASMSIVSIVGGVFLSSVDASRPTSAVSSTIWAIYRPGTGHSLASVPFFQIQKPLQLTRPVPVVSDQPSWPPATCSLLLCPLRPLHWPSWIKKKKI